MKVIKINKTKLLIVIFFVLKLLLTITGMEWLSNVEGTDSTFSTEYSITAFSTDNDESVVGKIHSDGSWVCL